MSSREPAPAPTARDSYFKLSKRPLYVLALLLPLIIAYEVGAIVFLSDGSGVRETLEARRVLTRLFEVFGVPGLHLPAILLTVLLLTWHVVGRYPWRIRSGVVGGMWVESCLWTVPLLLLGPLLATWQPVPPNPVASAPLAALAEVPVAAPAPESAPGHAASTLADHASRLTIAIGAGLYEELVFRLILIALVHALASDVARLGPGASAAIAIIVSAGVFAGYHRPDGWVFVFYLAAGCYFAMLYLWRGFGIAAVTHALYDAVALVLLPSSS